MMLPSIFNNNFVDDFFDDVFTMPFSRISGFPSTAGMTTDVQEFDDCYEMDVELPGYKKEDLKAELKEGYLTISAEHNENKDEKDQKGNYIRRERYSGRCSRSFYVGDDVTQEDIKAAFENGVLKISVPKVEKKPEMEEKKYIPIAG